MFNIISYFFGKMDKKNFGEIVYPLMMFILGSVMLSYCIYITVKVNGHRKEEIAYKREIDALKAISVEKDKEIAKLNIIQREKDEVIQNLTRMSQNIMRNNKQYNSIVKETDGAVNKILNDYGVTEIEGTHGTKWEDDISLIRMDALWKGYCLNNQQATECKEKGY